MLLLARGRCRRYPPRRSLRPTTALGTRRSQCRRSRQCSAAQAWSLAPCPRTARVLEAAPRPRARGGRGNRCRQSCGHAPPQTRRPARAPSISSRCPSLRSGHPREAGTAASARCLLPEADGARTASRVEQLAVQGPRCRPRPSPTCRRRPADGRHQHSRPMSLPAAHSGRIPRWRALRLASSPPPSTTMRRSQGRRAACSPLMLRQGHRWLQSLRRGGWRRGPSHSSIRSSRRSRRYRQRASTRQMRTQLARRRRLAGPSRSRAEQSAAAMAKALGITRPRAPRCRSPTLVAQPFRRAR